MGLQIGITPDGSRKWARKNRLSYSESYFNGAVIAGNLVKHSLGRGDISRIVFYGLSAENVRERKLEEVGAVIIGLNYGLILFSQIKGISVSCFGDESFERASNLFKLSSFQVDPKMNVDLLVNYSPDWDFKTRPIRTSRIPTLDLVIRTEPEARRLSGFLPLQSANAQLYFPTCFWPEFTLEKFDKIIEDFKAKHIGRIPHK
ncbi:MAG: undecaprenyl diphosphate synthase family protein [Nanoarchaeota archaeon]